jgi:hypothetical protein
VTVPGRGGLPARRPDQVYSPPAPGVPPGSAAGIFVGRRVVIFVPPGAGGAGSGLFVYAGQPALGNLPVLSIVAPGTTADPYGNPVVPVLEIQGADGVLSIVTPAFIQFPRRARFLKTVAEISAKVGGGSPAQFVSMGIKSASTTTAGARDLVEATFNSAAADNSSSANMEFIYFGSNGTAHEYAFMDITGFNILVGSIVAAQPGSSPATAAVWTTLALQNGYLAGTNNGFSDVPQIRLMADNKNLQFKGTLIVPAAPASDIFALLPASFPNANLGGPFGFGVVASHTGGAVDHIQVQNNSNILLQNGTGHGGDTFDLCCMVPTQ